MLHHCGSDLGLLRAASNAETATNVLMQEQIFVILLSCFFIFSFLKKGGFLPDNSVTRNEERCLSVSLSFEQAYLPPFRDILIIGQDCSVGANGVSRSLEFLIPNGYEMETLVDNKEIAAVIINKVLLKRISKQKILEILQAKVFPYIATNEIVKVDMQVVVRYENFDITDGQK